MHVLSFFFFAVETALIVAMVKYSVSLILMSRVNYLDSTQDPEWQDATMRRADRIASWPFQPDKSPYWWRGQE